MDGKIFEVELLHCGEAVFDNPVVRGPAGVFGDAGAVAIAAAVEGQGGLERWKGIDRVGGQGRRRWCALDDLEEDA